MPSRKKNSIPWCIPEIIEHKFLEDGTFVYVALIDVKPQFELNEYKGLEVEKPTITVSRGRDRQGSRMLQRHQAVLQTPKKVMPLPWTT
jgi:trigger factor